VKENCPANAPQVCDVEGTKYDNICHYLGEMCSSRYSEEKIHIPSLSMCPEDDSRQVWEGICISFIYLKI